MNPPTQFVAGVGSRPVRTRPGATFSTSLDAEGQDLRDLHHCKSRRARWGYPTGLGMAIYVNRAKGPEHGGPFAVTHTDPEPDGTRTSRPLLPTASTTAD
jgi:hypothetical protein